MKRLLLSLLSALSFIAPGAMAEPLPVPFLHDWSGHIFDASTAYNGAVRVYVDPSTSYMEFNVNGQDIGVDWAAKIDEAIAEWNAALGGALTITRVDDASDANVVVSVEDNPSPAQNLIRYAGTSLLNGNIPTEMKIYQDEWKTAVASNAWALARNFIQGGADNVAPLLNFMTRFTAKHELGHALGLEHSNVNSEFSVTVQISLNDLMPPIMTADGTFFIRRIFSNLNQMADEPDPDFVPTPGQRLVTADDIAIAVQEADALQALFRADQADCTSFVMSCIKPPYINDGGPPYDGS